jgi:hypothetical protein
MAEERCVEPQHELLQTPELNEAECEGDVVAEIAEIAEMIVDALQLEQDGPQPKRPRRRRDGCNAFDRLRIGPGICNGGIAAHAARQASAIAERHAFRALLDPLCL